MNLSHSVPPSSNNLDAQPDAAHADVADAARELGLKPIRAWVPDQTQKTNRTGGAQRAKRCREKAEQHGFKQLSRVFPVELHPFLSTLSTRTKAGDPAEVVLAELAALIRAAGDGPLVQPASVPFFDNRDANPRFARID